MRIAARTSRRFQRGALLPALLAAFLAQGLQALAAERAARGTLDREEARKAQRSEGDDAASRVRPAGRDDRRALAGFAEGKGGLSGGEALAALAKGTLITSDSAAAKGARPESVRTLVKQGATFDRRSVEALRVLAYAFGVEGGKLQATRQTDGNYALALSKPDKIFSDRLSSKLGADWSAVPLREGPLSPESQTLIERLPARDTALAVKRAGGSRAAALSALNRIERLKTDPSFLTTAGAAEAARALAADPDQGLSETQLSRNEDVVDAVFGPASADAR